ncbi:MAG: carboxypeptidase-like regulatory domain-containing protein [Planctomycetaceae bacterium]|nr:carboxypeptidase regulatory-like domain-containing protein [Planctomycetaceae bacterium]
MLSHVLAKMLLSSLLLCLMAGCGGTPGSDRVTGSVEIAISHGGDPLAGVSVQMTIPGSGKAAGGELDDKGQLSISNVEVGTYRVFITPKSPEPGETPSAAPVPDDTRIPQAYRSEATTPLVAEVIRGKNLFSFDLKE